LKLYTISAPIRQVAPPQYGRDGYMSDLPSNWMPIGAAANVVAKKAGMAMDPRFRHLVMSLYELGPRPIGELISEIAAAHSIEASISECLERYARLDSSLVASVGASEWPAVHSVGGSDGEN